MGALDGLRVEVENPGFGRGPDGSILRIRERTGVAVAETSDIIFVPTESLFLRGSGNCQRRSGRYRSHILLELV